MTTLTDKQLLQISRFLSFVLRHRPEYIGIKLDDEGWTDVTTLVVNSRKLHPHISEEVLKHIVNTDDKGRYQYSEDFTKIRAVQGHSAVERTYEAVTPPAILYHGTADKYLGSITDQGLLPMKRRHVHLSDDSEVALSVGKRHGKPVVMVIDSSGMHAVGYKFYRAENGVYLTNCVPFSYITFLEDN